MGSYPTGSSVRSAVIRIYLMVLACFSHRPYPSPRRYSLRHFSSEPSCIYTGNKDAFILHVSGFVFSFRAFTTMLCFILKRFLMLLDSAELEFRIRENMPWATSVDGGLCFVTAFATIRKNKWRIRKE